MDIRPNPRSRTAQNHRRAVSAPISHTPAKKQVSHSQPTVHRKKSSFSAQLASLYTKVLQSRIGKAIRQYYRRFVPVNTRIFIRKALSKRPVRYSLAALAFMLLVTEIVPIIRPFLDGYSYDLGSAEELLPLKNDAIAKKLVLDTKNSTYQFNAGYSPTQASDQQNAGTTPHITATIPQQASKGITVSDPVNKTDFTMTPKFGTWEGKQSGNRVVYPLHGGSGWLVYTLQGIGVKEDIILKRSPGSTVSYSYDLSLGETFDAKLLPSGAVAIYGNTLLSGNVATSSDKDAALLQKARKNAPKNKLLFTIPTPVITEPGKQKSSATAKYRLDKSTLTVDVTGLDKAKYPLAIDPSIYVETAQKFMNGNNETNIDFDVTNSLIQKGKTTGARFNQWNNTMGLNSSLWQQGVASAGGFVYQVGGQAFNGRIYSSAGTDTYIVPNGVTSITVKVWGAGGGGGAGSGGGGIGGNGGGGGFTQTDLAVTPGQVLNIEVGTAGAGAGSNRLGGNGGGYSAVKNGSTFLAQAGGGGGGGGTNAGVNASGGAAGSGGGTSGTAGAAGTAAFLNGNPGGGGGAGTTSSGGTGGTAGTTGSVGANGAANAGGNGGGSGTNCNTAVTGQTGGAGGTGGGGKGGTATNCSNAGGGGGGRFGGGGGGSADNSLNSIRGAGGGGGGSGFVAATGTSNTTQTTGSGTTPGGNSDSFRNGAGQGGTGASAATGVTSGGGGLVVVLVAGGATSSTAAVNWAKFSPNDGSIVSADPGTGSCPGWCSSSSYDLPAPRANLSMVAYNGFLYAIGGEDASCTTANGTGDGGICKTVYISKLGANGEPRLWHPTDTNQSNWVYWHRSADLSSPRSFAGVATYNNSIYFMGGKTSSGGTPSVVSTVEKADITGTGALTAWSTSGMVSLRNPSSPGSALARFGFGTQIYNGRIYVIGGGSTLTGAPLNNAQYITLNADGTMAGNWITTTSFNTGRVTNGGNFTVVWGGYIYIVAGCTTLNASGYCTNVASDIQLASINADGSLDTWATNTLTGSPDARMGYNLIAWRGNIYEIGGCSNQDTTTGACVTTLSTILYGTVNQDGDASTVNQSSPSGTAPCSGASPYSCNLPTSVGNVLNATAVMNGYLYIMGGCSNNACSTVSTGITYQAIGSDGTLQKPATCTGTYTDSYCVSSANLPVGLAATGTAVFGGRIYLVGGFNNGNNIYYTSVNADGSLNSWSNKVLASITSPVINRLTYSYAYARANPNAASTNPGNLYIFGGCTDGAVGCSGYSDAVYKCDIDTTGGPINCSTSGQLQLGTLPTQLVGVNQTPTNPTGPGLGAAAGTVYANYIYLIGGLAPGITDMDTVRYAKFDNNNNVVAVNGSSWTEGANKLGTGRRRGAGFGYNGYLYAVGGYDGTSGGGVLRDIEFAKINVSDGSWGSFTTSSVTINQRWGLSVPVSNSFAYVIGGCTVGDPPGSCTTRTSTIQTFQIYNNDSGAPAGYTTGTSIGADRIGGNAAISNGYIYYVGGCSDIACTTTTGTTYYAPLDANGIIGSWSGGNALPSSATRAWGKLVASGGTLYYIGGQTGAATSTAQSTVFYSTGFSSGNPTWGTATTGLTDSGGTAQPRTQFGAAVWNNRIYVVGGYNTSAVTSSVLVSPSLPSGGNITSNWSSGSSSINVARAGAAVVTYANNLYVLGGFDGTNYLSDVQYGKISTSNGNVSNWTYSTSLPTAIRDGEAFAANGYMYVIGGRSAATSCRPITLVAPISANTTIASGNNPTGVGEWYETNQRYSGDRYGAAVAYRDGKAYVLGGGCSSFVQNTGPDMRTYYTTLLSQPQVAQYSIMFDNDTDVYPKKWLLNGLDNSIGASWLMNYKSMSTTTNCNGSAMTTWGQPSITSPVVLGQPYNYTAYNGAGANMNCARYYYLFVAIDSSQAYGYPEDVSRGPTITDLTLQFTADPSKRLMHGRTFTGGLQQPIDTPYN